LVASPRLRAAFSAHVSGPEARPDTTTVSAGKLATRRSTVSRSIRRPAPTIRRACSCRPPPCCNRPREGDRQRVDRERHEENQPPDRHLGIGHAEESSDVLNGGSLGLVPIARGLCGRQAPAVKTRKQLGDGAEKCSEGRAGFIVHRGAIQESQGIGKIWTFVVPYDKPGACWLVDSFIGGPIEPKDREAE
jgi:hypothetical protein